MNFLILSGLFGYSLNLFQIKRNFLFLLVVLLFLIVNVFIRVIISVTTFFGLIYSYTTVSSWRCCGTSNAQCAENSKEAYIEKIIYDSDLRYWLTLYRKKTFFKWPSFYLLVVPEWYWIRTYLCSEITQGTPGRPSNYCDTFFL